MISEDAKTDKELLISVLHDYDSEIEPKYCKNLVFNDVDNPQTRLVYVQFKTVGWCWILDYLSNHQIHMLGVHHAVASCPFILGSFVVQI